MLFVELAIRHAPAAAALLIGCICATYVVYQRFIHPLSRYPGPFWASLTNIWKAFHIYRLDLHEQLLYAHQQHGSVVRVGPNDLHFWGADAIAPIYKAGRKMAKTEFYDAFTAFQPNLFGGRDESIHSLRRRQVSHGLSQASITKMESIIEIQMEIFFTKLTKLAGTGEIFDLKQLISLYVLDILGEVAFGRPFRAQVARSVPEISAINDHLLLSCVIGSLPCQNTLKAAVRWFPVGWIRRLMKSRDKLKQTCSDCVENKRERLPDARPDLLQSLLDAKDSDTGAKLTDVEIKSEAFAMLVAGSHSTSGTLALLLWHILSHEDVLNKVDQEIRNVLGDLPEDKIAYPITGLEASLPYTRSCMQENFRIAPVFNMCLWRSVTSPGGAEIDGQLIPCKTNVAISNYALHHNPDIWGSDVEDFVPERFCGPEGKKMLSSLIPFSIGHRACIGRNLALTNIWKTVTTLVNRFDFEVLSRDTHVRVESSGIGEMSGPFLCTVSLKSKHI